MRRVTIGGIGNVLLGDDGVGPYTIALLQSQYAFDANVEIADFGTPGLEFLSELGGQEALILVDAVENGDPPGTITLYDRDAIVRSTPAAVRMDPHSPALGETLLSAEMLGCAPRQVLLIGIAVTDPVSGVEMTPEVKDGAWRACERIIAELRRLGCAPQARPERLPLATWWTTQPAA